MTDHEIYQDLKGEVCLCGKKKAMGKSFCREHYLALTSEMRNALYQREGYTETFRATARHLGLEPDMKGRLA